jgi:hypothetical protein
MPALVKLRRREQAEDAKLVLTLVVLGYEPAESAPDAANGLVGGVNAPVYTAVPLITRRFERYPK